MNKKLIGNLLAAILPAAAVLCFILVRMAGMPDEASALYAQAAGAVEKGDYGLADMYFSQLEEDYPEYLPQYELQAERYMQEGDFPAAIDVLEEGAGNTGSGYLQQMADTLSGRPELSYKTIEAGVGTAEEEQVYPQTELAGLNYDFVVRYTNTQMDRQIQLSFDNYYSTYESFYWTSSNPLVATVDQHGLVTCGSQPGEAEITVTGKQGGMYGHCWVYVIESEIFEWEDTTGDYRWRESPYAFIPEGSFQYLDFYDEDIEEKIDLVQNNSAADNIPLVSVQGSGLSDSGIGVWEEEPEGGLLYERVDENGNPIVKAEDGVEGGSETAGEIQLDLSWITFYFSGDYRIPDSLRASNGKSYTVTSVELGSTSEITHLYIPATVTSLGQIRGNPFESFRYLESIEVEDGNPSYSSVDGVLYSADGTRLIAYPAQKQGTSFAIPDGVTEIGSNAFAVDAYSYLILNGEIQALQTISIPASVTDIEPNAFSQIETLKKIELDPGNTHFKMENGFLMDLDGNVIGFSPDTAGSGGDLVIANASEEISFVGSNELENLTIDAEIGSINIENCESLRSLTINGETRNLYVYSCPALEQVTINASADNVTISHYNKEDLRVTLNAPVSSISIYAPYIIENLDYVTDSIYGELNAWEDLKVSGSLTSLNVTLPDGAEIDPSILSGSPLRELRLTGGKLSDLSFLAGMADLWCFELTGTQVEDWSGLWDASQLTMLGLENCADIHDISGVANLTGLVSAEFSGMEVDDIAPLASCTLLQSVDLNGTKGLDNLSALAALSDLHYIVLDQSDASSADRQAFVDAGVRVG